MFGARHATFASMLTPVLRELHPGQANRRPAVFILEVAAALLSVLALRDGILGSPATSSEALFAVGLWGALLAVACGLAIREAWPPSPPLAMKQTHSTGHTSRTNSTMRDEIPGQRSSRGTCLRMVDPGSRFCLSGEMTDHDTGRRCRPDFFHRDFAEIECREFAGRDTKPGGKSARHPVSYDPRFVIRMIHCPRAI